jgi:VacB/RNase II family 3'-5' exoribonuclease
VEVKFQLDEQGRPIGVYLKESKDANKLIEEFMLLANRSVAEFVGKRHRVTGQGMKKGKHQEEVEHLTVEAKPFVYRVHEGPVNERLQSFAAFAGRWGYQIKTGNDREIAHSLNDLMKSVRGKKEQNVLEQLAIRSMSKAVYTTDNVGHYGLAFDYYTHFTSPIRRYPDVMVHRILAALLENKSLPDREISLYKTLTTKNTEQEIGAQEAERDSIKDMLVQYWLPRLNTPCEGTISGVMPYGIFVRDTHTNAEGFVHITKMREYGYLYYNEKTLSLENEDAQFRLGDLVSFTFTSVREERNQLEAALIL